LAFHDLIYDIESYKISLCRLITDWGLESSPSARVSIPLPKDPFSPTSERAHVPLTAVELREVFIHRIWQERLKGGLARTLERSKEELKGASVSVVLLSGGSANIGWLEKLLIRDFSEQLGDVDVLRLPDYQEVVAKGLAIECARRVLTSDRSGDFSAVTYTLRGQEWHIVKGLKLMS
jgi:molecular chaperone DnaK (HSP70)